MLQIETNKEHSKNSFEKREEMEIKGNDQKFFYKEKYH